MKLVQNCKIKFCEVLYNWLNCKICPMKFDFLGTNTTTKVQLVLAVIS